MNAARRKILTAIIGRMHKVEAESREIAEALRDLESIETDAFTMLSESFQQSDKGQAMEENANALADAAGIMEELAEEADNAAIALGDNVQ